jgi:hypothetical protein
MANRIHAAEVNDTTKMLREQKLVTKNKRKKTNSFSSLPRLGGANEGK